MKGYHRIAVLSAFIFLLTTCADDNDSGPAPYQWKKLGLTGKTVNELQVSHGRLYVATNAGLFMREIDEAQSDFLPLGFTNKNVEALAILGDGELIVSLFDRTGAEEPALYHSGDDGETWDLMSTNFGDGFAEPVIDLAVHPDDSDILFATGFAVVAKSSDRGETWERVYGDWGALATGISVVAVNPHLPHELWAGGQGAIENGYLIRSTNEADWEVWNDLVDNPTVVKEITFSGDEGTELFVGFEGALLKTTDGGDTWTTLIDSEAHKFFFGVCLPPGDTRRVYAGGWLKTSDAQPLLIHVSDDAGITWKDVGFEPETFGGIWDMAIHREGNTDRLFLGLDKGGVYEVVVTR